MPSSAYSDPPTFTPLQTLTAAQQNALGDAIRSMYWWTAAGSIPYAYDADQLEELAAPARVALLKHNASIPSWLVMAAAAADARKVLQVNAAGNDFELAKIAAGYLCVAKRSSTLTLVSGSEASVDFDTEVVDDEGWHDNSTNPSRITVDVAGYYTAKIWWARSGVTGSLLTWDRTFLYLNGSEQYRQSELTYADGATIWHTIIFPEVYATAGQYFEITLLQNTGGNRTLQAGCAFSLSRSK